MTASPRLGYTELTAGQAVPETTVNDSSRILEAFANATHFKSRASNPAQPGSPADGDCYLLTGTPTGTNWAGQGGKIAIRVNTAWIFKTAKEGFLAWVDDEDVLIGYDGAAWVTMSTGSGSYQPLDADLTAIAALATTSFGRGLLTSADAAALRSSAGATTIGGNVFTLTNPSAITFPRYNADNSVSALTAAAFRTAIGAGTGSGSGDLLSTNNLSDLANAGTARTNLGLGSIATEAEATAAQIQAGTASKAVAADKLIASAAPQTLTDAAPTAWDMSLGYNAKWTLGASRTLSTPTNPVVGMTYCLNVIQDGTGSRTVTWPASFDWGTTGAPTLTTTASKRDRITLFCTDAATPKFDAFLSGKGFS